MANSHNHGGKEYQRLRNSRRNIASYRRKRNKRKEYTGVLNRKNNLKISLLNVDGLTLSSLEDVKDTIDRKQPDVCILLETKRREEDVGINVDIPGYTLRELRRSDTAGDKGGGGIAVYTRQLDGLVFHDYFPEIKDQDCHFVRNERIWITTESAMNKSAVCGAYFGCQHPDNRNASWNDAMYKVIHEEAMTLKRQGYKITILGDFNGHIGCQPGTGIVGNNPDINHNGHMLLDFLHRGGFRHVNGEQHLTTGLWTRQRGAVRSVLDLALVSEEDLGNVVSLTIDDKGQFGGSSDHNWLFLTLQDSFAIKRRIMNLPRKKSSWRIVPDMDWSSFKNGIKDNLNRKDIREMNEEQLASFISSTFLETGKTTVGLKDGFYGSKIKPRKLPPSIVKELKLKRKYEKEWKTASTTSNPETQALEKKFLDQKQKANEALFLYSNKNREKIKRDCSGNSVTAKKNFWHYVTSKEKQSTELNGAVDPDTGVLKCGREEIAKEVEKHMCKVFHGGMQHVPREDVPDNIPQYKDRNNEEHSYSINPNSKLPNQNNSGLLTEDPGGWLDREYTVDEVKKAVGLMKGGRAKGWDNIPNEFIINSPDEMFQAITTLFNKIKVSGKTPPGWNKGKVTLVFKKGLRELLGNYRPITVLISLSGLYSRVLNARLTEVVETHKLLGEDQNGFRKGRGMADNAFILDSILWKARALKQKVHLCYIDITKAYDSVNRDILWDKLSSVGFGGQFLQSLKALYTEDSLVCTVNGISTGQVFPQRGLRQGCSLSPLLFALYISEIGKDLSLSTVGFKLGNQVVSGLCFADDIVLIAKDADGLLGLINLVKAHCDSLKLDISEAKSKVVSPEDQELWQILGPDDNVVLTLKSLLSYIYLGTETTLEMSSTVSKKQQRCITIARRYKFACYYLAKSGPDIVDMAIATWNNIAIPSILSGCEMMTFPDSTIEAIERIQSQLAKSVLGLSQSAPNICAQSEMGFKPFRLLLWRHQLNFYLRLIKLPQSRWASKALQEHLSGGWSSPYIAYITRIMETTKLFALPPTERGLDLHLTEWSLSEVNKKISSLTLPCISTLTCFQRQNYVYEHRSLPTIAEFRLSCAGLGNKAPNREGFRWKNCILCHQTLDEEHVAFMCPQLEGHRRTHTSITSFRNHCRLLDLHLSSSYVNFVNGLDVYGVAVSKSDHKERGNMLASIKTAWMRMTGYNMYSLV